MTVAVGVDRILRVEAASQQLRRADEGPAAAERDRIAGVVASCTAGFRDRVDQRVVDPDSVLGMERISRALVGLGANVAARRADQQHALVQCDGVAEVVPESAGADVDAEAVAPVRARAVEAVDGAPAGVRVRRTDGHRVAVDVNGGAEAVKVHASRASCQVGLEREAGTVGGVDPHCALASVAAGRADRQRCLAHRHRSAEAAQRNAAGRQRLAQRPAGSGRVVGVGGVDARSTCGCRGAENGDRTAQAGSSGGAREGRHLRPAAADALEQINRTGVVGALVGRADDQRTAGNSDRGTEAVVDRDVAALQLGVQRPVAVRVGGVNEDRAAVVEARGADDGGVAVDRDRGAALCGGNLLWNDVSGRRRPCQAALAEAVQLVGGEVVAAGAVVGADEGNAVGDQLRAGTETQTAIGVVDHHRRVEPVRNERVQQTLRTSVVAVQVGSTSARGRANQQAFAARIERFVAAVGRPAGRKKIAQVVPAAGE